MPETKSQPSRIGELLGGQDVLHHELRHSLDAHDLISKGLPSGSISHLVARLQVIKPTGSLEKAVGMSLRTFQRRKDHPSKPLSQEQSGRAWKFAEVLTQATDVFGSQAAAEQWLERPALALGGRRPIDLLATPAGTELVQDVLGRLDYEVYT